MIFGFLLNKIQGLKDYSRVYKILNLISKLRVKSICVSILSNQFFSFNLRDIIEWIDFIKKTHTQWATRPCILSKSPSPQKNILPIASYTSMISRIFHTVRSFSLYFTNSWHFTNISLCTCHICVGIANIYFGILASQNKRMNQRSFDLIVLRGWSKPLF